jgi:hypothetical protein
MRPFNVLPQFAEFRDTYPSAVDVARVCTAGGNQARLSLARLWLSEGIPFAFRQNPALYDQIRSWLASRLNIDPKEITIIGSARLGQSLSGPRFGTPFSEKSDLDFTTISASLFERLASEFNAWALAYEAGSITPNNARERYFWDENIARGPEILCRGFMDSKLIPHREPYPCAREIGQTMYLLIEKLKVTPTGPVVRHADIRAYRSWDAFAHQMAITLSSMRTRATT